MPEDDVVLLNPASFSDYYGPLINAIESRENLTMNYVLNKIFEENSRMNECRQTKQSAQSHSVLHT